MADGDIIVPLAFDDGLVEDPRPPFYMGSCAQELYEGSGAAGGMTTSATRWVLARLCEALGRMRQPISDLVRAWSEEDVPAMSGHSDDGVAPVSMTVTMPRSGWSRAAHPRAAPGRGAEIDLLPFVGQLAGVRGIEPLSNADRREAIKRRGGLLARLGGIDPLLRAEIHRRRGRVGAGALRPRARARRRRALSPGA